MSRSNVEPEVIRRRVIASIHAPGWNRPVPGIDGQACHPAAGIDVEPQSIAAIVGHPKIGRGYRRQYDLLPCANVETRPRRRDCKTLILMCDPCAGAWCKLVLARIPGEHLRIELDRTAPIGRIELWK